VTLASPDGTSGEKGDVPPGHFFFSPGKFVSTYPPEIVTLPERLRSVGYTTALVAANLLYRMSGLGFDGNDFFIGTGVVSGKRVNENVFWLLDRLPKEEPLFLLVHYMDVHEWPRSYFKQQFPDVELVRSSRSQVLESYSQAVKETDAVLGSLVEMWAEKRDVEKSLIVFLSDHGEHLKDPWFDHGNSMDEVLLHVPLTLKPPKGFDRPPSSDRVVGLVDLTPTILDILKVPYDARVFSGPSLMEFPDEGIPRYLVAEFQLYGAELASIRQGPFKLVLNLDTSETQFVDVRLPDGNPDGWVEKAAELLTAFHQYEELHESAGSGRVPGHSVGAEESIRALRSMGYVK
jgi:arylsulfatase A-like enzyme